MTQQVLMQRVRELERDMKKGKAQLRCSKSGKSATAYIGMFRDDPDFKDAMARGAAYRRSQKPNKRPASK